MKFQMLAMGARFEFEGKVYVKSGPLTAMTEPGESRMIPRFALLKPLDASPEPARKASRMLDVEIVKTAFDRFYQECADLMTDEKGMPPVRQDALDAARARFLSVLGE